MSAKKIKLPIPQQAPVSQPVKDAKDSPYKAPKIAIVIILVLTAMIYGGAVKNGITFIDDDEYLLKNPYLRDFSWNGIKAIFTSFYEFNYHPLTTLTWLTEFRFFGLDPMPYHAFNVVLHLINTWIVYRLAVRLSGRDMTGLVVAVLFAVHPMHVESVAWISERKGLLCALFYFLSLLYYVRYIDGGFKKSYYIGSLLVFVAALLSKSAAVTLPVVMLGIDMYRGRKFTMGAIAEKLPFFILALLFGVLAIMSQQAGGAINDITIVYGFVNRIFIFTAGIAFYIVNIFAPLHLSAIHYFPNVVDGILPWQYYASAPFLLLLTWLVARRSAYRKELFFGVLFFIVSISVMLQIVTVGAAFAAERYTYVSYFGFFYIAGQWLSDRNNTNRSMHTGVLVIVVAIFSMLSWKRVEVWKNADTVFADIIEKNEGNRNNYLVYYHWADYKQLDGKQKEALEKYDESIKIEPANHRAYLKRGELNERMGNLVPAIMDYDFVIKLNPRSAMAYHNKGWAYFEMGDKVLSIAYLDTAIALDSKLASAYNNRGWIRLQAGDTVAATRDFDSAIQKSDDFTRPYFNRAIVRVEAKDLKGAIADYTEVLKIDPSSALAYYNRGLCYLKRKQSIPARMDFVRADKFGHPDAASALTEMGND